MEPVDGRSGMTKPAVLVSQFHERPVYDAELPPSG
jgi:hypothetical protein